MKLRLYAIKDELSEFEPPWACEDDAQAKRTFRYRVDTTKMMADNPEDFSLWHVGEYDTKTGETGSELPFAELIERAKGKVDGD